MNTGVQRSSTTPFGAWTSTTPVGTALRGKTRDAKPLPILMVMHRCEYVATASLAYMEDYYAKLDKAIELSKKGMAYLHVFSPCPTGWRYPPSNLIEVSRKAVETNMAPLWEYTDKDGSIHFTKSVDSPLSVNTYLSLVGKYRHLSEEQITHIQETTDRQIEILKGFTGENNDVNAGEARQNVA
jgi:phenylglyoxylate dehydrogenase beta subunit